jgi:hypothetical protein
VDPQTGRRRIWYEAAGEHFEEAYPDDGWHEYQIVLMVDGHVAFYRDYDLKFLTTSTVDMSAAYPSTKFQIKGRAFRLRI